VMSPRDQDRDAAAGNPSERPTSTTAVDPVTDSGGKRSLVAAGVAAGVAAVLPSLVTLFYFVGLWDFPTWMQQVAYAGAKVVQFGFPLAWLIAVERRRPRWPRHWWMGIGEGVGFGALVLAGTLLLYHLWLGPWGVFEGPAAAMREKVAGMGIDTLAGYVAFALFVSLVHALLEEYYYRWFLYGQLRRLMHPGLAVPLASVAFMAHHVIVLAMYFGWFSPWTWLFSAAVAIGGAYWAWLYERTGSLMGPWLSHILADVAIFTVGYWLLGLG